MKNENKNKVVKDESVNTDAEKIDNNTSNDKDVKDKKNTQSVKKDKTNNKNKKVDNAKKDSVNKDNTNIDVVETDNVNKIDIEKNDVDKNDIDKNDESKNIKKDSTQSTKTKMTFKQKLKWLWNYFNTYEKIWYLSLFLITILMSIFLPEEDTNGISGILITILYFFDVVIALFCELLTSKQSKWSFMIYNVVEIIEIAVLVLIRARFASMATAIFFWIPIHTLSFFNWNKHRDEIETQKTVVRTLKWWQSLLMILGSLVWTAIFGYLVAAYGPETDFYSSEIIVKVVAYLDACLSALNIIDGVLLYFRYKEAWIIWYIYTAIEVVINIVSGQWILLVLKAGYLSNTIYGHVKWERYIKNRKLNKQFAKNLKS